MTNEWRKLYQRWSFNCHVSWDTLYLVWLHFWIRNLRFSRRVDILHEYEERTDKFLKDIEFSPLNHPRPDIKGDLDKMEIQISNLRAEKQKNSVRAFSVNAPESETDIDDRCQQERRSQIFNKKNLEEHVSTPAGPEIQERRSQILNKKNLEEHVSTPAGPEIQEKRMLQNWIMKMYMNHSPRHEFDSGGYFVNETEWVTGNYESIFQINHINNL